MDEGSNDAEPYRRPPVEGIPLQGGAAPCGPGLAHCKGNVDVHHRPFPGAPGIFLRRQPLPITEITIIGHVDGRSIFIQRPESPMGMMMGTTLLTRMAQVMFGDVKPLQYRRADPKDQQKSPNDSVQPLHGGESKRRSAKPRSPRSPVSARS